MGDIDALTKFLGHYNDLEYGRVYRNYADCYRHHQVTTTWEEEEKEVVVEAGVDEEGSSGENRRIVMIWMRHIKSRVVKEMGI